MPYPTNRRGGTNSFAGYKGSSYDDPLSISYKRYKPGAYIRLRMLDLSEDSVAVIPCRAVSVLNPQSKQMMTLKDVHEPEDASVMHTIIDHAGNPMSACGQVNLFRCPVFVYYTVDDKGVRTDINQLRYLEFGQGLKNSMDELENFQQGMGTFNEDTGRPDYDIDLLIVEGEGSIPKNYEFAVVLMDSKTKKQHANFGIEAEEVLENLGFMDAVSAEWDAVQDSINKRMTEDEIRQRVEKKGNNQGVSNKPGFRGGREDEQQEGEQEPEAEDAGQASRFGAQSGGRRYQGRTNTNER